MAQPEPDPWPMDDHPLGIQADEMLARQLDTEFAGEIRTLVYDPEVGLAGKDPEEALIGIAESAPKLDALKERFLAQAIGPRQRSILGPMIDSRLERATGEIGRIAQQATTALDDRVVADRIAGLGQDAALSWDDPAYLRRLGRAAVSELRYQGERRGWDADRTDSTVRKGLSDLYAGAVEQAIGQDPDRAVKLYDHARDVIQPERQATIEQKMNRTREERRVTEIVSRLSETPDDPARRPDLDDYQARATELMPADASPEMRAQVARMAAVEHAQADHAWQAARGRAAAAAVDWLGKNPAASLLAMPAALRDGLSPAQTEALDRVMVNGGNPITDHDLYDRLERQATIDPEGFVSMQLDQYRLSLGSTGYERFVGWQSAIKSGHDDSMLVRLGRTFGMIDEALRRLGYDVEAPEAQAVRVQARGEIMSFGEIEGRPATRQELDGIVVQVIAPLNVDPGARTTNSVTTSNTTPVVGDDAPLRIDRTASLDGEDDGVDVAGVGDEGDVQVARALDSEAVLSDAASDDVADGQQVAQAPGSKPSQPGTPAGKSSAQDAKEAAAAKRREEGRRAWDAAVRAPYVPNRDPRRRQEPLPDNWEETLNAIDSRYADWTKEAARKRGIPPELLARLFYKESDYIKTRVSPTGAKGIAQLTPGALQALRLDPETFKYDDPQASIEAGAAYLALMYREFKNWPKAVAAYNTGATGLYKVLRGDEVLGGEARAHLKYVFRGQPDAFDHYDAGAPNQKP
ncbi:MAG: lytic transglycosylase domain-containing protein [Reyranella sp.]|nr:lytic transglycosylase domain-containing protein [Reyranella sp.]